MNQQRARLYHLSRSVDWDFPCGSTDKEFACNEGDLGLIPGLERSPGKGKGYPLQRSGLENSMNCIVHGVTQSQTHRETFTFTFSFSRLSRTQNKSLELLYLEKIFLFIMTTSEWV